MKRYYGNNLATPATSLILVAVPSGERGDPGWEVMKQFNELTKEELEELEKRLWERAVKQKRELLWDLVCVYPNKE